MRYGTFIYLIHCASSISASSSSSRFPQALAQADTCLYLGNKAFEINPTALSSSLDDIHGNIDAGNEEEELTEDYQQDFDHLALQSEDAASSNSRWQCSRPDIVDRNEPAHRTETTSKPLYFEPGVKLSKLMLRLRDEWLRLHMSIDDGPIRIAEMTDHFNMEGIHQNQVTKALVKILQVVWSVDDDFLTAFRHRRRLITDTRSEIKYYRDQCLGRRSEEYEGSMDKIVDQIKGLSDALMTKSIEEVERLTRLAPRAMYTKQDWDRAVLRFIVQTRDDKQAAYFQRLRMDHEKRSRKFRG